MVGGENGIQKKAFQIIYDIVGIVLKWDKKQLSDNEAMKEIVKTLESDVENDDRFFDVKEKSYHFILKKKILSSLAITTVFFVVFFVANPFFMDDESIITEDNAIRFEQLNEIPLKTDEPQKNSTIEEFGNKTNII